MTEMIERDEALEDARRPCDICGGYVSIYGVFGDRCRYQVKCVTCPWEMPPMDTIDAAWVSREGSPEQKRAALPVAHRAASASVAPDPEPKEGV